jgi:hypothetical protein
MWLWIEMGFLWDKIIFESRLLKPMWHTKFIFDTISMSNLSHPFVKSTIDFDPTFPWFFFHLVMKLLLLFIIYLLFWLGYLNKIINLHWNHKFTCIEIITNIINPNRYFSCKYWLLQFEIYRYFYKYLYIITTIPYSISYYRIWDYAIAF